jgi:hypothetical protein
MQGFRTEARGSWSLEADFIESKGTWDTVELRRPPGAQRLGFLFGSVRNSKPERGPSIPKVEREAAGTSGENIASHARHQHMCERSSCNFAIRDPKFASFAWSVPGQIECVVLAPVLSLIKGTACEVFSIPLISCSHCGIEVGKILLTSGFGHTQHTGSDHHGRRSNPRTIL